MRYFLIKKCRIVGHLDNLNDILIANEKIIEIGKNIARPSLSTYEFDANGRIAIPGMISLNSDFVSLQNNDELSRLLHQDLSAGVTTWISPTSPSDMATLLSRLNKQEACTLNYSLNFDINKFKHGDLNKIKQLSMQHGIPTLFYQLNTPNDAYNDRLDLYIAAAVKNNMTFIVNINLDCDAEQHVNAISTLCQHFAQAHCNAFFTSVRYVEEFDAIAQLKNQHDNVRANILYNPLNNGNKELTEFNADTFIDNLRQLTWVSGDIKSSTDNDGLSRLKCFEMLAKISDKAQLSIAEMTEFMTTRKARFLGLTPQKGIIKVGADADLCLINDYQDSTSFTTENGERLSIQLSNTVGAVVMNGRLVFDQKIIHENIYGHQAFRRYI